MVEKKTYETYKKVSTLGTGSFGTAYLVECQSNREYAVIKQIDIQQLSDEERKETLREAKILEVLSHPNIIRFREVYKTKKGKLCIVMDYADNGDLQTKIKDKHKAKAKAGGAIEYFTEDQVLNLFTQICLAIKHCHDRKILHRDLKSQNIFLTKRNIVKLGDFGIARVLSNTRSKAKTVVGTPYYLSPEIIENMPYSFKSDIWSLGVLLYEMSALCPPFNAQSLHQLAQKIIKGQYEKVPKQYSASLGQLIGMMLQKDPARRPSINAILKMPIIEKRIGQFLEDTDFKDEFSHTLLHNQDVFKAFARRREDEEKTKKQQEELLMKKKQADEEQKKRTEEEEARQKMEALKVGAYRPPQSYYNQYQDEGFFYQQYEDYKKKLSADIESESSEASFYQQPQKPHQEYDDREDQLTHQHSSLSGGSGSNAGSGQTGSGSEQYQMTDAQSEHNEEMINLYTCDFEEFANHMSTQYGREQFSKGFQIISKNKELIYTEEGEEQLIKLLSPLFKGEDIIRGFLNYCTSYMIVQNYSQNIQA